MFLQHDDTNSYTEAIEAAVIDIDNFHEAAVNSAAEMEYNYNSIMEAIAIEELTSLKDNKKVQVAKDTLKRFWERIKKFFINAWAKVKGLFKKFIIFIEGYIKKTDAFFTKYKSQIDKKLKEIDMADIKFIGYKFGKGAQISVNELLKASGLPELSSITNLPDTEVENANRDAESTIEKMRGKAVQLAGGSVNAVTESELHKELFKAFRDGKSAKEDLHLTAEAFKDCSYSKDGIKVVKESYSKMEQNVNEVIKKAEAEAKDPSEDAKASSKVNIYINFVRKALAIANIYCGAQQTAIKDEANQCQKFASQILRAPAKKESKNENTVIDGDDIFSRVIFR